jgi:hypothetical protein
VSVAQGCHLFALDTTKSTPTLCVATKKKLVILQYEGMDWIEVKEVQLVDAARALAWCGNSICVGMKRDYVMVHVPTGTVTDIFPTGKSANPVITLLPGDQLLLSKDGACLFVFLLLLLWR